MDNGYLSDESDFYGDSQNVKDLEGRAEAFDTRKYWDYQARLPDVISREARFNAAKSRDGYHNPYEGEAYHARQMNETAEEFVKRLPPSSSTAISAAGPFLWIADPTDLPRFLNVDYKALSEDGTKLMDKFARFKSDTEARSTGRSAASAPKKIRAAQEKLSKDIQSAAMKNNVTTGKWMLFPKVADLDHVWLSVCQALLQGTLGPSAKVATAGAGRGGEDARLICVYTSDFSDTEDIKRVLTTLRARGLVKKGENERPIWYKIDAYTHLGIEGKNVFGLRNSLYGSDDFL